MGGREGRTVCLRDLVVSSTEIDCEGFDRWWWFGIQLLVRPPVIGRWCRVKNYSLVIGWAQVTGMFLSAKSRLQRQIKQQSLYNCLQSSPYCTVTIMASFSMAIYMPYPTLAERLGHWPSCVRPAHSQLPSTVQLLLDQCCKPYRLCEAPMTAPEFFAEIAR